MLRTIGDKINMCRALFALRQHRNTCSLKPQRFSATIGKRKNQLPTRDEADMPKERLHILLADKSLDILENREGFRSFDDRTRRAYLLGSVLPDALFYDLPAFRCSAVGNSLHKAEEGGGRILENWIGTRGTSVHPEIRGWVLGMTMHFWTDDFWHPFIEELSGGTSMLRQHFGLTRRACHHWLESELEAYWLNLIGPKDGYLPLLRGLLDQDYRSRLAQTFSEVLNLYGLPRIPSAARINRCILWQALLLGFFSDPRLAGHRRKLMARRSTRYLGSLVVPLRPILPAVAASIPRLDRQERGNISQLFDRAFMAEAVKLSATRLLSLPISS
jgi:hypothetical protein